MKRTTASGVAVSTLSIAAITSPIEIPAAAAEEPGVTPVTRAPDEVCSRVTPKYPRRGKGSGCATTIPAINPTTNLTIDILIGSTQTVIWICSLATKAGEKGTERYYDKVQHVARSLSTTRRKSNNSHADEVLGSTSTTARLRSRRAERFCNVP